MRGKAMPKVKSEVERQTLDVEHELPSPQGDERGKTGQENARAALPAEASREEPQNLRTERDSLLDRLIRLQAEIEDIRKRAAKEQDELRQNTLVDAVKLVLPVLDTLNRQCSIPTILSNLGPVSGSSTANCWMP
jgi:molecular chaperone GrpE (heat shock protein)